MKDDKRIIEIDGQKYSIDRTFDNSPAVYRYIDNGRFVWTDGKSEAGITLGSAITEGLETDNVIIIARKVKPEENKC